jgi:hypothetical protein
MPSATAAPPTAASVTSQRTLTRRRDGRLLRMRSPMMPPMSSWRAGATASATVSTMLAPIASPTST